MSPLTTLIVVTLIMNMLVPVSIGAAVLPVEATEAEGIDDKDDEIHRVMRMMMMMVRSWWCW